MNESAHPVVEELRGREPVALENARGPSGIPAAPGFYAWWLINRAALPDVPLGASPPHLLYVGIAPSRASSRATLRSRVLGNHIGGNLAASTFRRSLAALLWRREGWTPYVTAKRKLRFTADENAALTAWQFEHLRLTWAVAPKPWTLEAQIITDLQPPFNIDHNAAHPFCEAMKQARADCVASAAPWP